jgi:hypothetical protein
LTETAEIADDSVRADNKDPKMGYQASFHGPSGTTDFLGLRTSRMGATEIVYDDGLSRRMIWRVASDISDLGLTDALQAAVGSSRVLPTLHEELKKRAIRIDWVDG